LATRASTTNRTGRAKEKPLSQNAGGHLVGPSAKLAKPERLLPLKFPDHRLLAGVTPYTPLLTKLRLVTSGATITTIPDVLIPAVPSDVQPVSIDGDAERRRLLLVHAPGVTRPETQDVAQALRDAAVATRAARLTSP
jgi:hypothetical protein